MDLSQFIKKYQKENVKEFVYSPKKNIKVTVCLQTYNHEKYISECLDSLLNQKTNFNFEISLGEDNSSDKTREICIKYAKENPNKIKLFLHSRENNINIINKPTGRFNFMYNVFNSEAEYIAFCEGDDYWIDKNKLQKQFDFLEKNKDFVLCTGNSNVLNQTTSKIEKKYCHWDKDQTFSPKRAIKEFYTPTHNIMFRRKSLTFPDFFTEIIAADQIIYQILSVKGKFFFSKDTYGVYRKHESSITSDIKKQPRYKIMWWENAIQSLENVRSLLLPEQIKEIDRKILKTKKELHKLYIAYNEIENAQILQLEISKLEKVAPSNSYIYKLNMIIQRIRQKLN